MLCAYCGEDRPATKEHVWSASLIRLTEKEAPYTFDPHREKVYGAHPQLKDTCAPCNNLLLSPADAAMLEFAQRHLLGPIEPETVLDLGDPRLTRWVLKTAYNHDRSHPELRTRRAGMWRPILPSLLSIAARSCRASRSGSVRGGSRSATGCSKDSTSSIASTLGS